ncbi:MAG: right-handed parallel beta-helix repeat-containing protein [Patescibacteria group bacterium]
MLKKVSLFALTTLVLAGSFIVTGTLIQQNSTSQSALTIGTASSPNVVSFTLINADTSKPVAGYENMADGAVLNLATLPTKNLSMRANTNPAVTGSVRFALDGNQNYQTEALPAYSLTGGGETEGYLPWTPPVGKHVVKATPFTKANAQGVQGTSRSIQFTVIDVVPPTQITTASLVNTTTNTKISGYTIIRDGEVIKLADLKTKTFTLTVEPANGEKLAKVQFGYDSQINYRTESVAPYSLMGDASGDYANWNPTPGAHTVTITPYKESNGIFVPGKSSVMRFTIEPAPLPPPPPPTPVATIQSAVLYNAQMSTPISGFNPLPDGAAFDVSLLPTNKLNILALAPDNTVAVQFDLDGVTKFGYQGSRPFFMAGDTGGMPNQWTPSIGSHTLKMIPFSKSSSGVLVAGTPQTIRFVVTAPIVAEAPSVYLSTPTSVTTGGAATITWSSTNATSCIASGGWTGTKSVSGSQTIAGISSNNTYTLTCTGPGGTAVKSSLIVVVVPPPPPVTPPVTPPTIPTPPVVSGYTDISPKLDSKVIYVANSGNNANDGTIGSPVQTVTKAFTMVRSGYPDQILLKRGDTFPESLKNYTGPHASSVGISGRSNSDKMVIAAYGSGPRPIIAPPSGDGLRLGLGTKNLAIVSIEFRGSKYDGTGINNEGSFGGGNLLYEDLKVHQFFKGISFSATGDFSSQTKPQVVKNLTVRRSVIVDNFNPDMASTDYAQGIYSYGSDGLLIEENVLDNNGRDMFGGNGSNFTHNAYIHGINWNVTVRNNIISRSGSHGLQLRSGGVSENNFFYKNPIHMSFGLVNGGGRPHPGGITGRVKNNVMIGNLQIENSGASTHDRGIGLQVANVKAATISDNIIAFNTTTQFPAILMETGTGTYQADAIGIHNLVYERNIVYSWPVAIDINRFGLTALNQYAADPVVLRKNYFSGLVKRSSVLTYPDGSINVPITVAPDVSSNFDAFITEARNQSKDNWRNQYTGAAAVQQFKTKLNFTSI